MMFSPTKRVQWCVQSDELQFRVELKGPALNEKRDSRFGQFSIRPLGIGSPFFVDRQTNSTRPLQEPN